MKLLTCSDRQTSAKAKFVRLKLLNTIQFLELIIQSQKTQGFCVADFATLSDKRRSRSKIVLLFNKDKRTLRSKI